MPLPLKVYLDSQDFSRFSANHAEASEYLPIKRALLDLRRRGVAEFVFSDIHVYECLPVDPKHGQEGMARIEAIVELCGQSNLPASGNVVEYELKKLAAARGCYRSPVLLSEDWFPEFELGEVSAFDMKAVMKSEIAKQPGISRIQRRMALKNAKKERRRMTLEEANQAGLKDLLAKYPIRKSDVSRILGIIRGTVSHGELIYVIKDGLREITSFCKWAIENWAEGEVFIRNLRDASMNFHTAAIRFYDDMRGLHEKSRWILTSEQMSAMLVDTFEKTRKDFLSSSPTVLAKQLLGIDVPAEVLRVSSEETPSLYSAYDYLLRVMFQSVPEKNARNPNKKRASDFSDGMHAIFLPMVDVFRADTQSQALLGQQGVTQRAKLAPSLRELPSFIERMAAARV